MEEGVKKLFFGFKMNFVMFEKDDDINYYMDLIVGFVNMWVWNYSVLEVDKLKVKFIVGCIIFVIVIIIVMVIGFVCLELYKVILGYNVE